MGSCEPAVFLSSCRRFQIVRKKYFNRLRLRAAEILTRDYKERKVVQDADLIQPSFACGCRSSSTPPSYHSLSICSCAFGYWRRLQEPGSTSIFRKKIWRKWGPKCSSVGRPCSDWSRTRCH